MYEHPKKTLVCGIFNDITNRLEYVHYLRYNLILEETLFEFQVIKLLNIVKYTAVSVNQISTNEYCIKSFK